LTAILRTDRALRSLLVLILKVHWKRSPF